MTGKVAGKVMIRFWKLVAVQEGEPMSVQLDGKAESEGLTMGDVLWMLEQATSVREGPHEPYQGLCYSLCGAVYGCHCEVN